MLTLCHVGKELRKFCCRVSPQLFRLRRLAVVPGEHAGSDEVPDDCHVLLGLLKAMGTPA